MSSRREGQINDLWMMEGTKAMSSSSDRSSLLGEDVDYLTKSQADKKDFMLRCSKKNT